MDGELSPSVSRPLSSPLPLDVMSGISHSVEVRMAFLSWIEQQNHSNTATTKIFNLAVTPSLSTPLSPFYESSYSWRV